MNKTLRAIDIRYNKDIIGGKNKEDCISEIIENNESIEDIKYEMSNDGCPMDLNRDRFKNSCHRHEGCAHCWKQHIDEHENWEWDYDDEDYAIVNDNER